MSNHAGSPELRIHLLGAFQVSVGGQPVPATAWRRRKAAALLKLLALTPAHRLHRERVLELLWPEMEPAAGANNLHHTLHVTRTLLHPFAAALRLEGEHLFFAPPEVVWTDVEAFEARAARARRSHAPADYRAALALYAGDLLPDDLYEEWTLERRAALHTLALALQLELGSAAERAGELPGAIEALQGALRLEPACEEAHAGLMRLYARTGRRDEALRQYEQLQRALQIELEVEPSAASRSLYERIRTGGLLEPKAAPEPLLPAAIGRHNLPAAVTSFIGREAELRELRRLLVTARLLTLTGGGGAGKTRLALEAAELLLDSYPDGIWTVELAPLNAEELVAEAVAHALQIAPDPARTTEAALIDRLRTQQVLLVLDNCEHLIDGAARLAAALLARCPLLTILATSRTALGIAGEVTLTVPPLSLPPGEMASGPAALLAFDAIRLLVERIRLRHPHFELDAANAPAAVAICRRLDGIPLAIELAAARGAVLSLPQIASRLHDALGLLTAGSRGAPPRQSSLRGALDWSHELLTREERTVFRRLAVFARGWTLEAAEAVVSDPGEAPGAALDCSARLVDQSLIVTERDREGEIRYRLLEPVRQYARERLAASGDEDEIQRRHAAYLVELLEAARLGLTGPDQPAWLRRLDAERDNLRSALAWSEAAAPGLGFHLAALAWFPWYMQGHPGEARGWLERMFAAEHDPPLPLRVLALRGLAATSYVRGEYTGAIAALEEALGICRALGDEEQAGRVLNQLAIVVKNAGDLKRAADLHEEGLALRRARGDRGGIAESLVNLGSLSTTQGEWGRAETFFREALAIERELGDERMVAIGLNNLGELALRQGEPACAAPLFREALALGRDLGEVEVIFSCLDGLAHDAASRGRRQRAARLHGAADAIRQAAGIALHAEKREIHYRAVETLRAALGDGPFETAWREGVALQMPAAIAHALGPEEPDTPHSPAGSEAASPLSARERQIALLVSHGLTNRQISARLTIAERTVDTHVSKILRKLGLASRAQLARWIVERGTE